MNEAEIHQVIKDFMDLWKQQDFKNMAALWTEDGDLINPWGLWGKDRKGVEKVFEKEHSGKLHKSILKQEIMHIRFINPDTAFVDVKAHLTGDKVLESGYFEHHCVYVFVQKNGKWKIASARPYQLLGEITEVN